MPLFVIIFFIVFFIVDISCIFFIEAFGTLLTPVFIEMNFNMEIDRLNSFKDWPLEFVSKHILAKTGFYYLGREYEEDGDLCGDVLCKCYFCKVIVGNWENGDDVIFEHFKWSRECPLLIDNRSTNNVETYSHENLSFLLQSKYAILIKNEINGNRLDTLNGPVFSQFISENCRRLTFACDRANLHFNIEQQEQLVKCGFFYSGHDDYVKCFYCGRGLKDFNNNDSISKIRIEYHSSCIFYEFN